MRRRSRLLRSGLTVFCILATLLLVGCGRSYSYRCTEQRCTASFEGPGELDLSDARGPTLEVVTIDSRTAVTVRVDGKDAKLAEGKPRSVAGYAVTLTKLDRENVTLRIE